MRSAWRIIGWCAGGAVFGGVALLACVLADPPPLQQPPPLMGPGIIHPSVIPPLGQVLGEPPNNGTTFVVPVQIDPEQVFQYKVFLDLDPTAPPAPLASGSTVGGPDGRFAVTFTLVAADLGDPTQCHTIEIVVAHEFADNNPASPKDPPGGDNAIWIYQPTGNCNFYDAGPFPEAGADAGDDADGAVE